MTAVVIAQALGGAVRNGQGWLAKCPAHDDRSPSLSLADGDGGKLLVKCFAGCDARAVLAALRQRDLLNGSATVSAPVTIPQYKQKDDTSRIERARSIWVKTLPAYGTLVEAYCRARGYTGAIPATLRFHQGLRHKDTGNMLFPVMIAAVTIAPDKNIVAVHRTYLAHDGRAKAPVSEAKMSLGPVGGGAVRLAQAAETLAVTEGIETALSIMQATGIATWAALSAGGIIRLILPPLPLAREVIICADHDANGVGQRAADTAAKRWITEGRHVRIALPPHPGSDFNDILCEVA
jgi:putative DNA primase/helicase